MRGIANSIATTRLEIIFDDQCLNFTGTEMPPAVAANKYFAIFINGFRDGDRHLLMTFWAAHCFHLFACSWVVNIKIGYKGMKNK